MSWQAYVDSTLVGSGTIDKGAIFNVEGNSVWAATPGFNITPQEMQQVVAGFKAPATIQGSGFHIAGDKMFTLKADDRSIYGKQGKTGVCIVKTKMAILIGHYGETVQPGAAATTVEKLGDYLLGVGY